MKLRLYDPQGSNKGERIKDVHLDGKGRSWNTRIGGGLMHDLGHVGHDSVHVEPSSQTVLIHT